MNKLLKIAALAAFATAGTTAAFAGTLSGRNAHPYVYAQSTIHSGYGAYALAPDRSDTVPSGLGFTERFGAGTQS